ncbi:unnamed protein product [Onchocerca flexuosa]|uniref:Uncharacterized protein n=1 Tax=Onchocerca flexuosa TaxID=387005 RepID=A0A183H8U4_9BILA|nr:unnamed protein product [Onchocerca flexuosa]
MEGSSRQMDGWMDIGSEGRKEKRVPFISTLSWFDISLIMKACLLTCNEKVRLKWREEKKACHAMLAFALSNKRLA